MISGITLHSPSSDGTVFTVEKLAAAHPVWAQDISLVDDAAQPPVLIFESCESTMEVAAQYARNDELPAWGAVIAVEQPGGRGQLRRQWSSGPGNLHVSFLLPDMGDENPLWNRLLPLMFGWCLQRGLDECGASTILKWPNDLIQRQGDQLRKICGMLIEDRGGRTIVGVGLNLVVAPDADQLRNEAAFHAGILEFSSLKPGPLSLWGKLVKLMKKEYQALLDNSNPREFVRKLSDQLLWMGETVTLNGTARSRQVTLLGIAEDGGLRIRDDAGEQTLYSGSISKKFQADVCP